MLSTSDTASMDIGQFNTQLFQRGFSRKLLGQFFARAPLRLITMFANGNKHLK